MNAAIFRFFFYFGT
ncbi:MULTISPECIES: pheST operon leader peptide PheM [Enterobacteriaceae]|nr:pheST operon leader peptide PheM [Escherichia coli]MCZ7279414.1 pheST operon leader peptide PheM [Salmonella enterica]HCK8167490.1 pheST operon leader peptide PheM [Salmonella enterica]